MVSEAPIILADEPTGNLDEETAKDIIAILKRMALDRQKCVIVVTHSKEVAQASDVVLELKKKQLIEKKKIKKGLLCFETLLHILHENGQSHYYC